MFGFCGVDLSLSPSPGDPYGSGLSSEDWLDGESCWPGNQADWGVGSFPELRTVTLGGSLRLGALCVLALPGRHTAGPTDGGGALGVVPKPARAVWQPLRCQV